MPKFQVEIELSEQEQKSLLENSIERVINTSARVSLCVAQGGKITAEVREDAGINWQDWEDLKWLVVKLFDRSRNAVQIEHFRRADEAKQKGL